MTLEKELRKIYKLKNVEETSENFIKLRHQIEAGMMKSPEVVGIIEALFSKKYRRASWNGIILAFAC